MAFRKNFKNNEEVNSDEEKKRIIRQHAQSSVKLLKYDEVKDVLMKSDSMKIHLEREEFLKRLKRLNKDELDEIEYEIAEKIIRNHQTV